MGMINEFKQFALKGNVMDLAVGVVIGAAFGKIVTSLVSDVIMPPLGLLLGNVDFSKLAIVLREPAGDVPGVTIRYGLFINTIVDFLIVALAIFVVVKQLNRFKRAEAAAPSDPTTKVCPYCQSTIAIQATRCPQCTSQL